MNSYILTRKVEFLDYVECVENMNISTIHALAKRIIKRFSPYIGLGENFKIVTGNYKKSQIVHKFLNEYVAKNPNADFGMPLFKVEKRVASLLGQLGNKNVDLTIEDEKAPSFGEEVAVEGRTCFSDLLGVIKEAEVEFRRDCNENNQVALSDLILVLGSLANSIPPCPGVVDYLFVDEFQDTDDVQIKLIADYQKVFGFNVFAVGDIKQCIYRFRGAEVAAFDTLNGFLKGNAVEYSLRKNYRTDRILLDKMNTVFEKWDSIDDISYKDDDVLIGTVEYNTSLMYTKKEYEDDTDLDNIVKDYIVDKTSQNPNEKVAILVRTNNEAIRIKNICEEIGKQVITPVGGSLYKIDPTIDLLKLLLALKYNKSASYVFNLYTTSYVNEPLDKTAIYALDDGKKVDYFYENLPKSLLNWSTYIERLRLEPLLKVLRDIVEDVKPWVIFAEKEAVDSDEKERYRLFYRNNLDQVFENISLSTSFDYLTISSLIEFLEIMIKTRQEEEERTGLVDDSDKCNLICTTVHKAKGLEYDHVLLPFCANDVSGTKTRGDVDVIFSENKVGYSILEDDYKTTRFVNNYYNKFKEDESTDRRKEEIRILYVAMTRAKRSFTYFSDGIRKKAESTPQRWEEMLEES
jgi:ATP-dependent exoDNAse (exonuclease V) beta subunit